MGKREFYKSGKPVSAVVKTVVIVLLILAVLAVFFFFYLQKYIVYTPDGLYLNIPLLQNARAATGK